MSWLYRSLICLAAGAILGCPTAPGDDDDAPGQVEAGLSECDSDDGTYAEVDGVWRYSMDGAETGTWRFGTSWVDYGDGTGALYWYGCVIEGGDQPYEWAGAVVLDETASGQALTPGAPGFDVGVFNAALNRNLDGDNDVFEIFAGSAGSGTVDEFDAAAGLIRGTIDATADPSLQTEADDVAVEIGIEFDLTWTP